MARAQNRPPPVGATSDNQSPERTPLLATYSPTSLPASASRPASTRSSSFSSSTFSTTSRSNSGRRRLISLVAALLSALCAGSVTAFSLYAPTLQSRLNYSQYRVNGLASAASVAMYVPVSLLGYLCDRAGPAPLALLAAASFGAGYAGAAGAYYRAGLRVGDNDGEGQRWYVVMVLSFVAIGVGTCSMYMSAVATCAKNFGRGKHRGLAVALPIAAFGLSGMWLSQVGSRLFGAPGDEVDVVRFFLFLAALLVVVGILGSFSLRIVNEEDLIEEAVEELERSGILDGSAIFSPGRAENGYGTLDERRDASSADDREDGATPVNGTAPAPGAGGKDAAADRSFAQLRKHFVLNAETRRFLTDHTMWCFALGFFFMIGPGEAFINNLGTVIKTLYPPAAPDPLSDPPRQTSPATHVSIVGLTSTVARLLTGTLTDLLAPNPPAQHIQLAAPAAPAPARRFALSRVAFLLASALLLSLGLSLLASGVAQDHGDRFWLVSSLVGAGYGAVFSLTPIIITVIWGVENFATNWGIVAMFPALGATVWGVVYSAVYTRAVGQQQQQQQENTPGNEGNNHLCYGRECYAPAFWAMAGSVWIACGLVLWAWKGRGGWAQRGVVV
ncbi:hypothetical protein VTJ83DRAFT_6687 [Remersonia thermophila]|uniref:Probable transporter MCH1 n=1 Tax=Remersonia thermophila TaxID=72144 RepID=A0ABR4D5I4_9PEZI